MGTNIYAVKHVTDTDKQNVIAMIQADMLGEAKKKLERLTFEWHIGKLSGGYRFIWAANSELYAMNIKSLKEFINNSKYDIYSEYGEPINRKTFFTDWHVLDTDRAVDKYCNETEEGIVYVTGNSSDWS